MMQRLLVPVAMKTFLLSLMRGLVNENPKNVFSWSKPCYWGILASASSWRKGKENDSSWV
jgi:hypothetical protein